MKPYLRDIIVKNNNQENIAEIIEKYELFWGLEGIFGIFGILCLFIPGYCLISNDIFFINVVIGDIIAVTIFLWIGFLSFRKNRCFPSQRQYWGTFFISLIFFPFYSHFIILLINCCLDISSPQEKITFIVDKQTSFLGKYFIVQSWRTDMAQIKIVNSNEFVILPWDFEEVPIGYPVTVKTKRGLLGLEYLVPLNKKE